MALGTTIRKAGSQSAFRAVDFEANLGNSPRALAAGTRRIALVSAAGAKANSRVFYNRVKGELDEALMALAPDALRIARATLLPGDRSTLGQPVRRLESWSQQLLQWVVRLYTAGLASDHCRACDPSLDQLISNQHGRQHSQLRPDAAHVG